jgi:hypothetical protein
MEQNRPGDTPGLQIEITVRSTRGKTQVEPLKTKGPADWPWRWPVNGSKTTVTSGLPQSKEKDEPSRPAGRPGAPFFLRQQPRPRASVGFSGHSLQRQEECEPVACAIRFRRIAWKICDCFRNSALRSHIPERHRRGKSRDQVARVDANRREQPARKLETVQRFVLSGTRPFAHLEKQKPPILALVENHGAFTFIGLAPLFFYHIYSSLKGICRVLCVF